MSKYFTIKIFIFASLTSPILSENFYGGLSDNVFANSALPPKNTQKDANDSPVLTPNLTSMRMGLVEVKDKKLFGYQLDKTLSKRDKELLVQQGKAFLKVRKGGMKSKQKLVWMSQCLESKTNNVFCRLLFDPSRLKVAERDIAQIRPSNAQASGPTSIAEILGSAIQEGGTQEGDSQNTQNKESSPDGKDLAKEEQTEPNPDQEAKVESDEELEGANSFVAGSKMLPIPVVLKNLKSGNIEVLSEVHNRPLFRAMKLINQWDELKSIREKVFSSQGCKSVTLSMAIAQKSEEYFPDEKVLDEAIQFYEKAVACATVDQLSKAYFRLSLLKFWKKDYSTADKLFEKLANQEKGDFNSRSLYWRHEIARLTGNKIQMNAMRERIYKEYPLNYHSLVLTRHKTEGKEAQKVEQILKLLNGHEPLVRFRSSSHPEYNDVVLAVEVLLEEKELQMASSILTNLGNQIEKTEVSFKLYVAWLMDQANMTIPKFKLLSQVFREDQAMISKSSLEIFYPMKRFDLIKNYSHSKVDPYLVSALIRQESGFNEKIRSPAGALGLMQVMPATARRMERVSKKELVDAKTNIRLGVRYFHQLLSRFGGDAELALAGYNAGPNRVDAWLKRYPVEDRMLFLDLIPFKETRDYVALIGRNYFWYILVYSEIAQDSQKIIEIAERTGSISRYGFKTEYKNNESPLFWSPHKLTLFSQL